MKEDGDNDSQAFVQYDEDGDKIINPGTLTEEQKKYFQQARLQHKLNMTKVQKIGMKVFKGVAFIGKPEKIVFKDFDVGKPHYLTFTLTNVSNAFNSFNVLPLPQKIRNYFEVTYIPKGKISPGITCDIKFKFLPQLNEDINSEFSILAQTGQINYPIVCTSKKAIVKCNDQLVNFGKVIEGEVGQAKLQLVNEGALTTDMQKNLIINRILKTENGLALEKADEFTKSLLSQVKLTNQSKIDGYSHKTISFTFEPGQIGDFTVNLQVYFTNFQYSPPIIICLRGQCIKVPVTIQKPVYDFQICLLNHIYRQKLCFHNDGDKPMSFKVSQPQGTKKFFEFNPLIGYIQKQSKIDVWVKFSANKDLPALLMQYMVDSNIFEVPFELHVKEQVLPVDFKLKFKISKQQLVISPPQLNFGTIFEGLSSKIEVTFENKSDLPQQILLYPLKKQIFVQNNQSLFKILPKSSVKKFITFKSKPLQDKKSIRQEGTIPCKFITGDIATSQIKIQYSCQTLKPALSLQHNKIDLKATQIDEVSYTSTVIKNNINKQVIFEIFTPPFQVCGLQVTPVVKVLGPDQEVQINIQYHSFMKKLGPTTLKDLEQKKKKVIQQEVKEEVEPPKQVKKDAKKETKLNKQQQQALEAQQKRLEEEQKLRKEKQEQERLQLQQNFDMESELSKLGGTLIQLGSAQHYKWVLPIYFKKKDHPDASAEVNFIEITTTSVEKILVSEQMEIDFGEIAVGARQTRQFVIKNLGTKQILKKKQLPVFGCFSVLNSLRQIEHQGVFKAIVEFQPTQNQIFQEKLTLYTSKSTISCILKGTGVRPDIKIEPQTGLLHLGGVILDQYIQKTFKIKNICNFQIEFILKRIGGGALNTNGSNPILYIPTTGKIQTKGQIQVKVYFRPDRINENFFEKIKVFVPQQKHERFIYVTGYCYPRQAYVKHYKENKMPSNEEVSSKIEYALDWMRMKEEELYFGPNNKQIILQFLKVDPRVQQQKQECFKKRLTIGSSKMLDPKSEKPTNFEFIMPKDDRFQCDNSKGTTAPGTETVVTFTYKPEPIDPLIENIPVLAGIGQWKDIKIELKLSGGFVKPGGVDAVSFDVILRAYVNQI